MSRWVFVGAPADSVLRGGGAELAPARLRELDVPARIGAHDVGDLPVRVRGNDRDPSTGIVGSDEVLANAAVVHAAVRARLERGDRVVLSGGCCANAPGAIAGARDALGGMGLIYVDGHQDMWNGSTSTSGEAADMPLGVAIGIGPPAWVDAIGGPAVAPADTVLTGHRDHGETAAAGLPDPATYGLTSLPVERVRELGPSATAEVALAAVTAGALWLHLDVDVLDMQAFPATDYLDPGGLERTELPPLLAPIAHDERLVGVSVGCFNPEKDPDGAAGSWLADVLVGALAT